MIRPNLRLRVVPTRRSSYTLRRRRHFVSPPQRFLEEFRALRATLYRRYERMIRSCDVLHCRRDRLAQQIASLDRAIAALKQWRG